MSSHETIRKRCPKCKSIDIYKRVRRDGLSKLTKGKRTIKKSRTKTKTYICRRCSHEFDVAFIEPV